METGGTEGAVVEATDEEAHEKVIFVEHRWAKIVGQGARLSPLVGAGRLATAAMPCVACGAPSAASCRPKPPV